MWYVILKIVISAGIIFLVTTVSKKSVLLGAVFASLPIVSLIAMIWLYLDTQNANYVAILAKNIFWLVLPSLILFASLPIFIQLRWNFYVALLCSSTLTVLGYFMILGLFKYFQFKV